MTGKEMPFGSRFLESSYIELVSRADAGFGAVAILTLVLASVGWIQGQVPVRGMLLAAVFLVANVVCSRVGVRLRDRSRVRLELLRIFALNGVLCPVVYLGIGGPLLPWWPGYLIGAIGSGIVLGALYPPGSWRCVLGVAFWGVNMGLAGILGLQEMNVYQFVLSIGATLMCGLVFLLFTDAYLRKAREENAHFNEAMARLSATQAQMVESGKLAALGQMAGEIAHEINSPLAAIPLALKQIRRLALSDQIDTNAIMKRTEMIGDVTDRIAGIVAGLRSFCRDGASEPIEKVKVGRIISETLVFCEERFRSGGIRITVDESVDRVEVECRPVQLSQVLLNLLNNSYDAVRPLREKWVQLSADTQNDGVRLVVRDSGPGIPPEIQRRIFDPFFTTKEGGLGTGLGLSISRQIIEGHDGSIRFDSAEPQTTVVIRLPRQVSAV